jgi:hypothetical protein
MQISYVNVGNLFIYRQESQRKREFVAWPQPTSTNAFDSTELEIVHRHPLRTAKQFNIVIMTASEFTHVIDWTEAMEQCGDDEDFLRELLSDLRGEIDAQIIKMDEVLQVRSQSEKIRS